MKHKTSFNEIVKSERPTLVDFHATWCGPCKMMTPILQELSKKLGDSIKILKIDVDKNQKLASKLNVKGVPTLVIYQRGKIVWRQSGVQSAHQLESALKPFLVASE